MINTTQKPYRPTTTYDRLCNNELTFERVTDILDLEQPHGFILRWEDRYPTTSPHAKRPARQAYSAHRAQHRHAEDRG